MITTDAAMQEVCVVDTGHGLDRKSVVRSLDRPLEPEELSEMIVEDIMKENLEISGKKLKIMSESQIGLALDDFVLKEQR